MFIDYKLENYMFRHFIGHRQIFSKITWDHSIYSARARCVGGEMSTSRLIVRHGDFCIGSRLVWLDSAKGALLLSSILGMLVLQEGVSLLFF